MGKTEKQKLQRKQMLQSGFTLIELLVVVAILMLLSSVVLTSTLSARRQSRDASVKSRMSTLAQALTLYSGDKGNYPPANPSTNDTLSTDTGDGGCVTGANPWQNVLLGPDYLTQSITMPKGSNYFCYFRRLANSGSGPASAAIRYNYCTIGMACGFSGVSYASYSACSSTGATNPDLTRNTPLAKAVVFFWLEGGISKDYAKTGNNVWFNPQGNAICLY